MRFLNLFRKPTVAPADLPDAPRQDLNLPFGIQFGTVLSLPLAPYVSLSNSLVELPDQGNLTVASISRLDVVGLTNVQIHRFYTHKGSAIGDRGQAFLQVLSLDGEVVQATYYCQLLRQVPVTAEEQEPYLGRGYGLGDIYFNLGLDLLSDSDLPESRYLKALNRRDALEFMRDAPTDEDYIAPYRATETRLDDAHGYTGMAQDIRFMPYWREVTGGKEMLTINFEKVRSVNGQPQKSLHVDYHIGLSLDPALINAL